MSLLDAAAVLKKLAEGEPLDDRHELLLGALSLKTATTTSNDRDLLDAAIGLERLATGGALDLDHVGRTRAAYLCELVLTLVPAPQVKQDQNVLGKEPQ